MINYIIPLLALVFNFIGFAFCIKFLLSKLWRYWILPSFLSLSLIALSLTCTVNIALEETIESLVTFAFNLSVALAVTGFIWIWCVLLFYFGLKQNTENSIEDVNSSEKQVEMQNSAVKDTDTTYKNTDNFTDVFSDKNSSYEYTPSDVKKSESSATDKENSINLNKNAGLAPLAHSMDAQSSDTQSLNLHAPDKQSQNINAFPIQNGENNA